MDYIIDIGMWLSGALILGGIIQWAKNLLPNVPGLTWAAIMPLAAVGISVAKNLPTPALIAWNALGIWACCQLFYELIVQNVKNKLKVPDIKGE